MSMLGPYASWNKETGYAVWDHPTAEYTGIFERINVGIKGIIHVGMWDFVEYGCYTKLVGNKVVGVEANQMSTKQWQNLLLTSGDSSVLMNLPLIKMVK